MIIFPEKKEKIKNKLKIIENICCKNRVFDVK